jgi:cytochrome c-type biogenesis protein
MIELFTRLSGMLAQSDHVALAASFAWGILSIVLSPCHLASIPLIVGFIDNQGKITTARAALLSTLFSSGILITIALIGVLTGLMGRMMGDIGVWGNAAVALLLIAIGLYLMGIVPLPFHYGGVGQPGMRRRGLFAAFLLGLIFGVALGPCTFAYMAPMLGVAFSVASTRPVFAALLVAAYALGHCMVIVLAGTFTELVQHLLRWNEQSRGAAVLKKICGILVIIAGAYMLIGVWRMVRV